VQQPKLQNPLPHLSKVEVQLKNFREPFIEDERKKVKLNFDQKG